MDMSKYMTRVWVLRDVRFSRFDIIVLFALVPTLSWTTTLQANSGAVLHVNLTIQEAIYTGVNGIERHQEPVTVGIPLADSAGIRDTSQLGLSGATAGQFRVLGHWASGNIQWVLVDTLADVHAGKLNGSLALTNGNGNFGGPDLAVEGPSSITVSTGPSTFTIRKQRFNVLDDAIVNGRPLLKKGASSGLVIVGPTPGNTTCPCATIYASSNDSFSTAVIEENGPVRAVVRSTGQLMDDAGHAYMRYTVRLHFYKGKTRAKIVILLQNADYGASNSFASSYKAFSAFEVRLSPSLSGPKTVAFGTNDSTVSVSLVRNDNAYLYQAFSDKLADPHWNSPDTRGHFAPRSYIKRSLVRQAGSHRSWAYTQEGWLIKHKDDTVAHAGASNYSAGWADLTDASGAGLEVGTYQMAAYWPKALQFVDGGSEARIGIWPDQSLFGSGGQSYYQPWPQYSMHTVYLDFHDSRLEDASGEFDKSQYPLVARAPSSYYNDTNVFFYPLLDPDREDRYFRSLDVACCIKDLTSPRAYRTYGWPAAGAGNQAEMRWSNVMLWLQRGHVARYLDASHFYAFQVEEVFPRSDFNGDNPFNWRDRPDSELGPTGMPEAISSLNDNMDCDPNEQRCGRNWIDNAHAHWYGMTDYYFLTGDESVKDAIIDGVSDVYGNPNVRVAKKGTYWNPRNVGEALMSDARLTLFYDAIGDRSAAQKALLAGTQVLSKQVWPELKVSGFGDATQGVSRTRGLHFGCCPPTGNRVVMPFQEGILSEGLWEFMTVEGSDWPDRQLTFDLAYGISKWMLTEAWRTSGQGGGCRSGAGPTYEIFIDHPNPSLYPSCSETLWFLFHNFAKYSGDQKELSDKFATYLKHLNGNGTFFPEYGSIFETAVVSEVLNPEPVQLVDIAVKVDHTAPDSYRLTWTVPAGTLSYRIKYSSNNIVDWLTFDPVENKFVTDPETQTPWFAATEVKQSLVPAPSGAVQTFDINGLTKSTGFHFAVKARVRKER